MAMEQMSKSSRENGLENRPEATGWEAWNAVPRDGPSVFVVDVAAFDSGVVRGRWLAVGADREVLHAELRQLLGRAPEDGRWAVVDQIGLGGLMVPETMTVASLSTVADDLAAERRQ